MLVFPVLNFPYMFRYTNVSSVMHPQTMFTCSRPRYHITCSSGSRYKPYMVVLDFCPGWLSLCGLWLEQGGTHCGSWMRIWASGAIWGLDSSSGPCSKLWSLLLWLQPHLWKLCSGPQRDAPLQLVVPPGGCQPEIPASQGSHRAWPSLRAGCMLDDLPLSSALTHTTCIPPFPHTI